MSFRQYGGINYAARNNIVKSNYTNANNLSVMTKVGQPSSYINFESDISGNTIYGPADFVGDVTIAGNLSVSENIQANRIHLTGNSSTYQDPSSVVPKSYIDSISAGIHPVASCQLATAENSSPLPLLSGLIDIDGKPTQNSYRVLVNNQGYISGPNGTPGTNVANIANGIYIVNSSGPWTRAPDCSSNINVQGQTTFIQLGDTNDKKTFVQNTSGTQPVYPGTDPLLYVVYNILNLSLGNGLVFTNLNPNNTLNVKSDLSSPAFITSLTVDCSNIIDSIDNRGIYTINNTINDTSALRLISKDKKNYIQSGTTTDSTAAAADLCFTAMNSTTPLMEIKAAGKVVIGTTNSTGCILDVNAECKATSFNCPSDYRIKENVLTLNDSSFTVDNLRPVTYTNKLLDKQDMGFIAHELQEHYPFLVTGEKDGPFNQSVNYIGLIALLVKEIQELKQDIKILKY
jgi:hypothetical protein